MRGENRNCLISTRWARSRLLWSDMGPGSINGLTINGFHWGEITLLIGVMGPLLITGDGADLVHILRIIFFELRLK